MGDLNQEILAREKDVIADLYSNQEGKAEALERHIQHLEIERKPKTMMEQLEEMSEQEKRVIQGHYRKNLDQIKKIASDYDEQQRLDNMLPEERRKE